MTVPALTAEWNCPRCGTTNRKLIPVDTVHTTDRCGHCGAVYELEPGPRPKVRWEAVNGRQ